MPREQMYSILTRQCILWWPRPRFFEAPCLTQQRPGVWPFPAFLLAVWPVATCLPLKSFSGCRSKRRPCVPSFTMLKWSCHLKEPSHQLTDHLIQYWHRNCHLKASKRGAFLFTCQPWHLTDRPEWPFGHLCGSTPWSLLAHPARQ